MHLEDISIYINVCLVLSLVQLFTTPWTVVCQDSLFMELSRQEYWRVYCHFLQQEIFLTQGSSLHLLLCRQFPALKADSLLPSHQGSPYLYSYLCVCVCVCANCSVMSDSLQPHELQPTIFSVHEILWARIPSGLSFPSPGDLSVPGIKPGSPTLAGRFFTI